MKNKHTIPISIGLLATVFSLGGSWAIVKAKADDVDKIKVQADSTEKKVIAIEVKLDNIQETVKDTKEALKENKQDLKDAAQKLDKILSKL